jgi:hypothetical protein
MRRTYTKLVCLLLAAFFSTLWCNAQHAENILRGKAARDYLLSAAASGDVGVQAAIAETEGDLLAKLAVDEDLAYDSREKKFLYACGALAVPDGSIQLTFRADAQSASDVAIYSVVDATADPVDPASYTGPDAVDPLPILDTVFKLHSRPESIRKVYLDFNGHTTSGTAWNSHGRSFTSPPYTLDDQPEFSFVELQAIIS